MGGPLQGTTRRAKRKSSAHMGDQRDGNTLSDALKAPKEVPQLTNCISLKYLEARIHNAIYYKNPSYNPENFHYDSALKAVIIGFGRGWKSDNWGKLFDAKNDVFCTSFLQDVRDEYIKIQQKNDSTYDPDPYTMLTNFRKLFTKKTTSQPLLMLFVYKLWVRYHDVYDHGKFVKTFGKEMLHMAQSAIICDEEASLPIEIPAEVDTKFLGRSKGPIELMKEKGGSLEALDKELGTSALALATLGQSDVNEEEPDDVKPHSYWKKRKEVLDRQISELKESIGLQRQALAESEEKLRGLKADKKKTDENLLLSNARDTTCLFINKQFKEDPNEGYRIARLTIETLLNTSLSQHERQKLLGDITAEALHLSGRISNSSQSQMSQAAPAGKPVTKNVSKPDRNPASKTLKAATASSLFTPDPNVTVLRSTKPRGEKSQVTSDGAQSMTGRATSHRDNSTSVNKEMEKVRTANTKSQTKDKVQQKPSGSSKTSPAKDQGGNKPRHLEVAAKTPSPAAMQTESEMTDSGIMAHIQSEKESQHGEAAEPNEIQLHVPVITAQAAILSMPALEGEMASEAGIVNEGPTAEPAQPPSEAATAVENLQRILNEEEDDALVRERAERAARAEQLANEVVLPPEEPIAYSVGGKGIRIHSLQPPEGLGQPLVESSGDEDSGDSDDEESTDEDGDEEEEEENEDDEDKMETEPDEADDDFDEEVPPKKRAKSFLN